MSSRADHQSSESSAPYPSAQLARLARAVDAAGRPEEIGPFRILEVIGEGGMGTVYKAEQHAPIHRTVAVKVIKLGMDTREVIARFEAERQALALMDHPNVARVIDAGATLEGRPYFVMEFVEGEPITLFADRWKLTVEQRLELFTQACAAVQHAHQKAIIHRDLKPSNILVTQTDGNQRVKVIDFGVAKAIDQRLTEKTVFTETGQFIGTLEYMSPEQADSGGRNVDTRSDVYSLGVVLYELLSGAAPFEATRLRTASFQEVQRIIREVDPPRPSTRLSALGEGALRVASSRQLALDDLERQLHRELDWIPLKAMRKIPAERYATASELSEDIRNYLANRPLRAGPESTGYRVRKFLRRNKRGVAASAAMLLLLLGGIATTSWQAIAARRERAIANAERAVATAERDNAQATLDFLTNDVLAGATPDNIPDVKVRDQIIATMITPAAQRVSENFRDRPLIEASVRTAIQGVLLEIGRSDLAFPHAETALSIRRRLLGEDHPDTIRSLHNYASVLQQLGHNAQAEPLQREALERSRRVLGNDNTRTLEALNNYAYVLGELGRSAEAEPLYKEALERYRHMWGRDHIDTINALNNYAYAVKSQGRTAEALPLYEEALGDCRRVLGEDHPGTIHTLNNYATALRSPAEIEPLLKQVVERSRRVFGEDHPDTVKFLSNYAAVLCTLGRFADAEPFAREAVTKAQVNPSLGPQHPQTRNCAAWHARSLDALGRHDEAAAVRNQFGLRRPATRASTRSVVPPH
jgi:non-specific serine/threonine protein kinase/serine/threonine-protein kinase